MIYLNKIPYLIQRVFPAYIWRYAEKTKQPTIYLTFDDGPTPEITDWVLDQLKQYKAKATFFVIGKNVKKYPEIVHRVIDAGHSIGNHTHTHKNGWETENKTYLKDFLKAQRTISEYTGYKTRLFRPPYGKINREQASHIRRTHEIIMMDVISGDFDPKLSEKRCYQNIVKHTKAGSIVLLHDSRKAEKRLKFTLPLVLEYFTQKGFVFKAIADARAKGVKIHLKS